jgi:phasin family protein
MITKKKSRKSPKTALISRPTRDSGDARPAVESAISVASAVAGLGFIPFGAEDVDAVARSSVALADGVQAFGRALIEMQRLSVSTGLSAARALVDARNLQDVIEVQRRFVNGSVEKAVRDTGGLAELANRVVTEAWSPLAPRVGAGLGRTRSS